MSRTPATTPPPKPTPAELDLLRLLWRLGPSTAKQVHEAQRLERPEAAQATVLRLLQVMHGKGLVSRDESQRAHVYAPVHSRESTEKAFVGDLIKRLFDGSASRLVLQALGDTPAANAEELRAIRALLERLGGPQA